MLTFVYFQLCLFVNKIMYTFVIVRINNYE